MAPWIDYPQVIRLLILETLLQDGCSVAKFATVSREWQAVIERRNFARLKLTPSRLTDFSSLTHRNRHLVKYIWLCVELEHYSSLLAYTGDNEFLSQRDATCVSTAIRNLFLALSTWEPSGELLLDMSIHSPSDSKYLLKYLTFEPDTPSNKCLSPGGANLGDQAGHDWINWSAIGKAKMPILMTFNSIYPRVNHFEIDVPLWEEKWWQQMPSVPAVTGVLLRQQTRRQWLPTTLEQMFACFPRLKEVVYEPWRKLDHYCQEAADEGK